MRGSMMDTPLMISSIIEHARRFHGSQEIVSRTVEGPIHRYTYRDAAARSAQLAHALRALGVQPGDRVATIAWNGYRHFELYYGVSGIGAGRSPLSTTVYPRPAMRSPSPAMRNADGPMSTPRRPPPRSSGTPMMCADFTCPAALRSPTCLRPKAPRSS